MGVSPNASRRNRWLTWIKRLAPETRRILSIVLAILVYFCLPASLDGEIRLLITWNVGVLSFLLLVGLHIFDLTPEQTLHRARQREPNAAGVLAFVVLTACTSVFVIGYMLSDGKTTPQPTLTTQIWLSALAILCSWLLTHTMFALHYARFYYNEADLSHPEQCVGGLEFPNPEPPNYWDFLYFAFTISMTSQTSDVSITSPLLRRLVLLHEVVSFFFYTIIIGTTVNTIASLL